MAETDTLFSWQRDWCQLPSDGVRLLRGEVWEDSQRLINSLRELALMVTVEYTTGTTSTADTQIHA